jgi:hypothetical protein
LFILPFYAAAELLEFVLGRVRAELRAFIYTTGFAVLAVLLAWKFIVR